MFILNHYSSVGVVTRLRAAQLGYHGSIHSRGKKIFLLSKTSTHPPIQWVPGAIFLWVKWLEHEIHHSPPPSAKVKNECSPCMHGDNFTFTYMLVCMFILNYINW